MTSATPAPYTPSDYAALLQATPASSIYINGGFVETSARHKVFGKADTALITECGYASAKDVGTAVTAARAAFRGWSGIPPAERAKVLQAMAAALPPPSEPMKR